MRNRKKKSNYRNLFARSAACAAGILAVYVIGLLLITLVIYKGMISEDAGARSMPFWCALCVLSGCFIAARSEKSIVYSIMPAGLFLLSLFLVGFFSGELDWAGEGRLIPLFCMAAAGMAGGFSMRRSAKIFKRRMTRL